MKDVAKLALYFVAIVVVGALLAPLLFWSAQSLAAHGVFSFLAKYDFETFFHRAILIAAALFLWPLLRISHVRGMLGRVGDPMMVASAFATLFVIGCILADARVLTRSLWLPIGLHAGWIFGSGAFSLLVRRQTLALPWLGKNLLVGIIPLGIATFTWIIMRTWRKHDGATKV